MKKTFGKIDHKHFNLRGFTLIELLIVVAIIAILAAIAVPNFLEAQTRSKVSRVKSDQRSLATAMESYHIDYNHYPLIDIGDWLSSLPAYQRLRATTALSTPVAYISRAFMIDPFRLGDVPGNPSRYFQFATGDENSRARCLATLDNINSGRLDKVWPRNVYAVISSGPNHGDNTHSAVYPFGYGYPYDPTNGVISFGDIYRNGPHGKVPKGWRTGDDSPQTLSHPF